MGLKLKHCKCSFISLKNDHNPVTSCWDMASNKFNEFRVLAVLFFFVVSSSVHAGIIVIYLFFTAVGRHFR